MKHVAVLCLVTTLALGFFASNSNAGEPLPWPDLSTPHRPMYSTTFYQTECKHVVVGRETYNTCTQERTFWGTATPYHVQDSWQVMCGDGPL